MGLHRQLLTLRCSSCHQVTVKAGRCSFNAWSPHLATLIKPLPHPACLTGAPHPILTSPGGTLPQSLVWGSWQDRTQGCLKIVMSPWGQRAAGLRNTLRPGFIHRSQVNVLFSFISPFLCPNRGWLFPLTTGLLASYTETKKGFRCLFHVFVFYKWCIWHATQMIHRCNHSISYVMHWWSNVGPWGRTV